MFQLKWDTYRKMNSKIIFLGKTELYCIENFKVTKSKVDILFR